MKTVFVALSFLVVAVSAAPNLKYGFLNGRVVGGKDAIPHEFAHMISLQFSSSPGGTPRHVCGGSILNENFVLTAGHCITGIPIIGFLYVVAGKHDLSVIEPTEQRVNIAERIVHEDYIGGVAPHDVALLRLATPLVFNDAVKPITLPAPGSIHSGEATLCGWGSTSNTTTPSMPNILQTVSKPIVLHSECEDLLGGSTPIHENNICTGPLGGQISACSGDSGGPLMHIDEHHIELIGIVSWAFLPCGANGLPSVYVRVSAYIDWIQDKQK